MPVYRNWAFNPDLFSLGVLSSGPHFVSEHVPAWGGDYGNAYPEIINAVKDGGVGAPFGTNILQTEWEGTGGAAYGIARVRHQFLSGMGGATAFLYRWCFRYDSNVSVSGQGIHMLRIENPDPPSGSQPGRFFCYLGSNTGPSAILDWAVDNAAPVNQTHPSPAFWNPSAFRVAELYGLFGASGHITCWYNENIFYNSSSQPSDQDVDWSTGNKPDTQCATLANWSTNTHPPAGHNYVYFANYSQHMCAIEVFTDAQWGWGWDEVANGNLSDRTAYVTDGASGGVGALDHLLLSDSAGTLKTAAAGSPLSRVAATHIHP